MKRKKQEGLAMRRKSNTQKNKSTKNSKISKKVLNPNASQPSVENSTPSSSGTQISNKVPGNSLLSRPRRTMKPSKQNIENQSKHLIFVTA